MSKTTKFRKAGRALLKSEARATRAAAPQAGSAAATAVEWFGKLGDQPELRTLSGMVIAGGVLGGNRRLLRAGIRMLSAHELATLGKDLIKEQFDRTRPHSAKSRREQAVKTGTRTDKTHTSFPSGHSAGAAAVARSFSRDYPEYQVPALAAAAVVAAMQVPRLNHYPTDVVAGMLLGVASEVAANLVVGDDEIRPAARPRPRPRA
jgi:membrane-associated phospholipid phosphatase